MLKIKINGRWEPVTDHQELNIICDYEGEQTLSFDVLVKNNSYKYFKEEVLLQYADNFFLIKKINQRKVLSTITASICLNEWKERLYQDFHTEYKLFSEVMLLVAPTGWIIEDAGSVTGRRAMTLEGVNDYDILMHCKKLYNIVFEYHTEERKIRVIKPDVFQSRGLYITDELNLTELIFKGDSSSFATRLYAYGKKTEERDEEGKLVATSYVDFADINDGKTYVDNKQYSDQIISVYWQDDRYTDRVALLDDAIDKLKEMSKPERSYSCNLVDLSRINEEYRCLDFKLYDKVTLLDNTSKIHVQHQIVQYVDYPENSNKNKVVLSSTFKSIVGTIDGITQNISGIDTEIKRKEYQINEIIRDVQSNTFRINNTYTKGETEVRIENVVQQTADTLNIAISKVEQKSNETSETVAALNTSLTIEQGKIEQVIKDTTVIINGEEKTTKEAYSYMQQQIDQINFAISESGGNNKLLNSAGWNSTNYWDTEGAIDSYTNVDVRENTISGYAFELKVGKMYQTFKTIAGRKYSIGCKIKKNVNSCYAKIITNEQEKYLFNLNEEYVDGWVVFSMPFEALGSDTIIEVSSDGEALIISDIMINDGEIIQQWSSSSDEIYTINVKIDKSGIEITQDDTNNKVVMNTKEFAGYEGNNEVFSVNGDTTHVNRLTADSDVQIGVVRAYAKTTGAVKGLGFAYIKGGNG